jgi:hypothetical protein
MFLEINIKLNIGAIGITGPAILSRNCIECGSMERFTICKKQKIIPILRATYAINLNA